MAEPLAEPTAAIRRIDARIVEERGWLSGSSLENRISLFMSHIKNLPRPAQQYRVGKYRLDYAWPSAKVALEADGFYHDRPEAALRDRQRDSWLRSQGWLVFRVDGRYGEDSLLREVGRVTRLVIGDAW